MNELREGSVAVSVYGVKWVLLYQLSSLCWMAQRVDGPLVVKALCTLGISTVLTVEAERREEFADQLVDELVRRLEKVA